MLVVYDSLTGMGKKVAEKLGFRFADINNLPSIENESKIFLLTRSFNFGEVTKEAEDFLSKHSQKVVGVAVSGNRNWGTNFGAAGDKISKHYNIPLVLKFEGLGFPEDIKKMKNWIEENS